jgi:hypothetical protein
MLRRSGRQQARWLAQADAEGPERDHGDKAYREARQRERDMILPDATTRAGRTGGHPRCTVAATRIPCWRRRIGSAA